MDIVNKSKRSEYKNMGPHQNVPVDPIIIQSIELVEQRVMNKLIERNLVECGYKASVIISGGGSSFISNILKFPGASEFVVDAKIPYSKEALFKC